MKNLIVVSDLISMIAMGSLLKKISKHNFRFKRSLYSLDTTTIDLWLSAFLWAECRSTKGAIKLQVGLHHNGYLPDFITITDGKSHEWYAIAWHYPNHYPNDKVCASVLSSCQQYHASCFEQITVPSSWSRIVTNARLCGKIGRGVAVSPTG